MTILDLKNYISELPDDGLVMLAITQEKLTDMDVDEQGNLWLGLKVKEVLDEKKNEPKVLVEKI